MATPPPDPADALRHRTVVAVDWSGDARAEHGAHPKMWLAVADGDGLRRLEPTSRTAAVAAARALAHDDPHVLLAPDFSFGFPAWFLDHLGVEASPEAWPLAGRLRADGWPFFGRRGTRAPEPERRYRRCEQVLRTRGVPVKSTLQTGGPGAPGTGSLRGMPHLAQLADDGWDVWPFSRPVVGRPAVVELYPRLWSPPVVKSRVEDRARAWAAWPPAADVDAVLGAAAVASEDAFDAAVSALAVAAALHGDGPASPMAGSSRPGWRPRPGGRGGSPAWPRARCPACGPVRPAWRAPSA